MRMRRPSWPAAPMMGPAQRATLELIADTFAPGVGAFPAASELGVAQVFVDFLESHMAEIDLWKRLAAKAKVELE